MNKKGFTLVELLGVIILLGILTTIAVVGYTNYLSNSKRKAFTIEEENFISATRSAYADCISNKTNNDFCSNHPSLETKYTYQFVYLKELIDDNYIRVIKNPYNVEQSCDSEKSYVYVGSRNDINSSVNSDVVYKACLICGNNKSKDCLDDDTDYSSFDTTCKAYYDAVGGEVYDGKWTDRNVVLEFSASGNYRYGISEYTYSINDSGSYTIAASSNDRAILTLNKDAKSSNYKVYALDGMNKKGTVTSCGIVRVDKGVINNVSITGKTKSGNTVISDKWTTEEVTLTANVNPSDSASGYLYQWYLNGEKYGEQTDINTLTVQGKGSYQVEVTNKIGKIIKKSNSFIVKVDTKAPTCTLKASGTSYNDIYIDDVTISFASVEDKENDSFDGSGVVDRKIDITVVKDNAKDKVITGTVTDGVGRVGTCSITITRDDKIPDINSKEESNKILNTLNKPIVDYFNVDFGPSGGSTICKVGTKVVTNVNELTLGINTVTCTASGNNGKVSSATTKFIHQYYATAACNEGRVLKNGNCTKYYANNESKCGCSTYKSCQSSACGTTNKTCANAACGVESYKSCANESACGCATYKCTLWKNCQIGYVTGVCIDINGTNTNRPCYIGSGIVTDIITGCKSTCYHECPTHKYICSIKGATTSGRQKECGSETVTGSACNGAKTKTCIKANTCQNEACGVASYKSCQNAACGSYNNTCRTSACGCDTASSCDSVENQYRVLKCDRIGNNGETGTLNGILCEF